MTILCILVFSCIPKTGNYHRLKKGETLYGLSRLYSVDIDDIKSANRISDPTDLRIGQRIYIPEVVKKSDLTPTIAPISPREKAAKIQLDEDLSWPIKGKILTKFGKSPAHRYDGINIEGRYGQDIMAVSNGEVMYSGDGIKGYGNMIIIKHRDMVYSIYALNSENLVSKGDTVKKSQVIAKVGGIPRIGKPFLHFQLRKGKRAINPLSVLQ